MNLVHAVHEPQGDGPHPTVVALHGWGASALDLLGLAPHVAAGRFLVLCPQGSLTLPVGPGVTGYGWFPLSGGGAVDPDAFARAEDAVVAFVDLAARRYPIASDKLALLGFSQGGVMAYALALRLRRRFAAVAALSSWLPPARSALDVEESLDGMPFLVQHGTRDPLIDVARARESVETLRRLKANVTYREYDMGHEISAKSLADLSAFLAERVISPIVLV
jgi:phospholipase/carboxylesterase